MYTRRRRTNFGVGIGQLRRTLNCVESTLLIALQIRCRSASELRLAKNSRGVYLWSDDNWFWFRKEL